MAGVPVGEGVLEGRAVVPGRAEGPALITREPLSFWGGYDPDTGEITDRSHPLSGVIAAGRVLVVPETRGSSTTTAVLLEAIRRGTAPAAFVTRGVDAFLALAAVVAEEMYGGAPPVVALPAEVFDGLRHDGSVRVEADGRLILDETVGPSVHAASTRESQRSAAPDDRVHPPSVDDG
jgi:predicted aconitase with swiveling domain